MMFCCCLLKNKRNYPDMAASSWAPDPHLCNEPPSSSNAIAQLICLAATLFSNLITTSFRSILLFFLPRLNSFGNPNSATSNSNGCEFYEGRVWHERRHPVFHSFDYPVRYALVDLDHPPDWFQSESATHHMCAADARAIAETQGTVRLLTMPTSVGYEQNPLSVYYCYDCKDDKDQELVKCIAEVTNTPWGERVMFVFDPTMDIVAKPLHVSPFMDMLAAWRIRASLPSDYLHIVIVVEHPQHGKYFTATLQAKRLENGISNPVTFFWLMPHKVAWWIYFQALILVWKGVAFISHPKYNDGKVYQRSAKEEDCKLQSSSGEDTCPRFFAWKDATSWPWA